MYTEKIVEKKQFNYVYLILGVIVIGLVLFLVFFNNRNNQYSFSLIGNEVTLKLKETYNEPGYICVDSNNNSIDVTIENKVNNEIPGEYLVLYRCREEVLTRKVTVLDPANYELLIEYSVSNLDITNEDIVAKYKVEGKDFDRVELSGKISTNPEGSFVISENGTYQILAYSKDNTVYKKEIIITNIDKEKPKGTCVATLKPKNTEITVNASDNNKIAKYEYYDNNKLLASNESSKYLSSSKTTKTISVKIYDTAGNYDNLNCQIIDKSVNDPILPSSGDNVVFRGETDTLKVYVIKRSSYFLTRIWAINPYSQLNKAASPSYGSKLYGPIDLLKTAINNKNLQNKLMVAFNASGFYLQNLYDADSVARYAPYDRTSVGTIVINDGKLIRNAYQYAFKEWYIMGINEKNEMVIFTDEKTTTESEKIAKQNWAQTVINSGIRNTFNFAGPVILNGKKLTTFSSSMPDPSNVSEKSLQLICQINENNFVLFTSSNANRNTAINEFLSMGCQTATNLDGGGSIALFYKNKNSSELVRLIGGNRNLPEMAYFNES